MPFVHENVKVELFPGRPSPIVHLSENDVGDTIAFELIYKGQPVNIPSGSVVKFKGTKKNGLGFTVDSSNVSGNVVSFIVSEDMTSCSGVVEAEISITLSNNKHGTCNVVLIVEKNPHSDGTQDGSYPQIISEMMALVNQIEGDAETASNAANTAVAAKNSSLEIQQDVHQYTADAIDDWLDEHPEATTTVQDGAITEAKMANGAVTTVKIADNTITETKLADALKLKTIKDYVTPEMYGAVGDGVTDDTVSIQNAVDNGNPVIFEYGKSYLITSSILLEDNTIINGNNATILNHGICTAIRKKNSTIKNVIIEKLKITGIGKDDTSGTWPNINSAIIIATNAKNIKIRDCEFTDFRYGVFIGGQEGENAIIDNCKFIDCKDAIDTFVSENGIISNCEFYNCYIPIQLETNTDVFTNNFRIFNNKTIGTISDTSLNMHSRIIDIEVFSNVFDKRTTCTGANVENLSVFDNVLGDKNGFSGKTKISNNIINGATYLETNFDGVVIGNYIESSTYAFQTTSDAKFINNVAKVGTAFLVGGGTIAYIIGLRLLSGQIVSSINYDEIVFFDYCGTATVSYAGIIQKLSAAYKYYNPTNS